jgi:hypothetical protein
MSSDTAIGRRDDAEAFALHFTYAVTEPPASITFIAAFSIGAV